MNRVVRDHISDKGQRIREILDSISLILLSVSDSFLYI